MSLASTTKRKRDPDDEDSQVGPTRIALWTAAPSSVGPALGKCNKPEMALDLS
jgi:hypothetical protein